MAQYHFSFSDKQEHVLRPTDFAYGNCTQIISLLVDAYKQLALGNEEEQRTTARELWEKTTTIMTDSVEKNLHIENGIATTLCSSHIPLNLLFKAHMVQAIDRSNMNVSPCKS